MSENVASRVRARAASAAVATIWTQWSSLTAAAVPAGERRAWTIVDPEALVLASLAFQRSERRLVDLAAGFGRAGGSLLSVTRMKRLVGLFPADARDSLSLVAAAAVEAGFKQWKVFAGGPPVGRADRRKDLGSLRLIEGSALMLRLRAGFGLNGKADVLAYLLGVRAVAEVRAIAAALGYTKRTIRTAADDLVLAEFIERVEGTPVGYRADSAAWVSAFHVFRLEDTGARMPAIPPWHYWAGVFSFLAAAERWASMWIEAGWSDYVASSRARDVASAHASVIRHAEATPAQGAYVHGREFLEVFEHTVSRIAAWAERSVIGESSSAAS